MMLSTINKPPMFSDDTLLRSIEWVKRFPWRQENTVNIKVEDEYEICLQVKDYAPEEISVKTADGHIVVEGKHEEKLDDYGYIARQFMRRFQVPEECRIEGVKSRLTADRLLVITAPRLPVVKKDIVMLPVRHESSRFKSKL